MELIHTCTISWWTDARAYELIDIIIPRTSFDMNTVIISTTVVVLVSTDFPGHDSFSHVRVRTAEPQRNLGTTRSWINTVFWHPDVLSQVWESIPAIPAVVAIALGRLLPPPPPVVIINGVVRASPGLVQGIVIFTRFEYWNKKYKHYKFTKHGCFSWHMLRALKTNLPFYDFRF